MAYDSQKGYNTDPNFDYSDAIRNAASEEEKSRLTQERQNKINDRYNGQEPRITPSPRSSASASPMSRSAR